MTDEEREQESVHDQLIRAARDLWSMVRDSGETYVVFTDRRRLGTRVDLQNDGRFLASWEPEEGGTWIAQDRTFESPREAALHAYQGPH